MPSDPIRHRIFNDAQDGITVLDLCVFFVLAPLPNWNPFPPITPSGNWRGALVSVVFVFANLSFDNWFRKLVLFLITTNPLRSLPCP
jgi:hypothetical protein